MQLEQCGVISRAFSKAVGPELSKEFSEMGGLSEGKVVASKMTGSLKCQLLLHVSLREWWGENSKGVRNLMFNLNAPLIVA